MSDKVRQMTNRVILAGKVAELEVRKGTTEKKVPYVSVKGTIQFGEHKAMARNFEKFAQEYSIKEDDSHKENKNYPKILEWAENAKSIAKTIAKSISKAIAKAARFLSRKWIFLSGDSEVRNANYKPCCGVRRSNIEPTNLRLHWHLPRNEANRVAWSG